MFKQLNFPILVIHPAIGQNNVAGRQLAALLEALGNEGFEVLGAEQLEEGRLIAEAHRGLACILFTPEALSKINDVEALFDAAHSRSPELPIMAITTRQIIDPEQLGALR